MKKLVCIALCLVALSAGAQRKTAKWFFSVTTGASLWGPSTSLRSQMREQNFDDEDKLMIFGFSGGTKHPNVIKSPMLMLRAGKQVAAYRSVYFVAVLSTKAKAEGFRSEGYTDIILLGGSYGKNVSVTYSIWQFTAGYQYTYPKSNIKLGMGPSAFIVPYKTVNIDSVSEKYTAVVPGASFSARIPLSREKKLVGADLILEANLAPPINLRSDHRPVGGFRPGKANMVHMTLGIACSFRKQNQKE